MSELTRSETMKLRWGMCPHCGNGLFQSARDGGSRLLLCSTCYREFRVPAAGLVEVVHELCPKERLREVYGISFETEPEMTNTGKL